MNAVPYCVPLRWVIERQVEQPAAFLRERQADQAAAVARHEVDRFGRDEIGGDDEVALVFAVFFVDEDHPSGRLSVQR